MMWPHTIAILLGGQGTRMGEPKHLVQLPNGDTLLDAMASIASKISPHIVVVGEVVDGFESIRDLRKNVGPVGGIEALIHSNLDEKYLVVGCDMPRLQPLHVSALLEAGQSAIYSFQDQLLGLPIVISANIQDACTAYLEYGGRSIKGLFEEISHQVIPATESIALALSSINTRRDLDEFTLEEGRS